MFKRYLKEIKLIEAISHSKTLIMGLCALWIFFYHFYIPIGQTAATYNPTNTGNILYDIFMYFIGSGDLGVDIFLILSGLSAMYSLSKNKISTFYLHRIKRIFPAFIISAMIYTIAGKGNLDFFLNLLSGVYNFKMGILIFSWYFWAASIFYAISPLIYIIYKKINHDLLILCLLLLPYMGICFFLYPIETPRNLYYLLCRVPSFLIGTFMGIKMIKKQDIKLSSVLQIVLMITAVACLCIYTCTFAHRSVVLLNTPWYILYAPTALLLIILLSIILNALPKFLKSILAFCGNNSYEIYIYSMSVDQLVYWQLSRELDIRYFFYIYLFITILVSHLSNYLFNAKYREKYCLYNLIQPVKSNS